MKFDREWLQTNVRLALPTIAALAIGTSACFAQSAPEVGDLNSLLAAKDWNKLGAALSSPDRDEKKSLEWLDAKLLSGGLYFVSWLYARELWSDANQATVDDFSEGYAIDRRSCHPLHGCGHLGGWLQMRGSNCSRPSNGSIISGAEQGLSRIHEAAAASQQADSDRFCGRVGGKDGCRTRIRRSRLPRRHGANARRTRTRDTTPRTECAGSRRPSTVAVEAPSDWRPTILPEQNYIPEQGIARAKLRAM